MSIMNVLNSIVPISRFNKGEASKIFDEVRTCGYKIVMKNNTPACILLSPENYQNIIEQLEDSALLLEAEKRMKAHKEDDCLTHSEILSEFGISKKELSDISVDID